jgi:AraC-like DNA-binding protein
MVAPNAARSSPPIPAGSRRTLGALETDALKAEDVEYASGLSVGLHAHTTANLIYVVAGTHWSGHSRGGDECRPGTVRLIPAQEPHENYFPAGSRCLQLELGPGLLDLACEEGAKPWSSGELTSPGAPGLGAAMHREFCRGDDLSPLALESLSLEILLLGLSEGSGERALPPWLGRVREMLRERATERLSLTDLSRSAGRHPVQVSRQFHRHFGCTIGAYVRRVRVARAQELLVATDATLAEISLACGFSDQSHFTNAFRGIAGLPPQRYRRALGKPGART